MAPGDKPKLPQSLEPLARIAVRDAGAEGVAIHEVDSRTGLREVRFAWGTPIPDEHANGFAVDSFPLRIEDAFEGDLTFVFREAGMRAQRQELLERIVRSIESVWRLTLLPERYARQAARIGELEAALADAKIADRARGLLTSNHAPSGYAAFTIMRHVESVLRPGQLGVVLAQLTSEMEKQIAERALATRAKVVLQDRYGMSEEQAHVHLRTLSRNSHKRLIDVAHDFLKEPHLNGGQKE